MVGSEEGKSGIGLKLEKDLKVGDFRDAMARVSLGDR